MIHPCSRLILIRIKLAKAWWLNPISFYIDKFKIKCMIGICRIWGSCFPISVYVDGSLILFITKGLPQLVVANVASHVASSFPAGARLKFPWLRCISPHQWI